MEDQITNPDPNAAANEAAENQRKYNAGKFVLADYETSDGNKVWICKQKAWKFGNGRWKDYDKLWKPRVPVSSLWPKER